MATTPILGLTQLEIGQAQKEATINANNLILDNAVAGGATGAIWARVTHSTTQSLTNNTLTVISFNTERADTNVIHDNSTNNSRLTCKTAGVYSIQAHLGYAIHATGIRALYIRLNGATVLIAETMLSMGGANETRMAVSTTWALALNDYVEVLGFQNSGGALNTEQASSYTPEFMCVRLGK